jgi:hypothetical protein
MIFPENRYTFFRIMPWPQNWIAIHEAQKRHNL